VKKRRDSRIKRRTIKKK